MEISEFSRIKKEKENEIKIALNALEALTGIRGIGVEVFRVGTAIMEVKIKVDL